MSTRQYIGARYVPKFYQNSVDGSASWEENVVYDPLTYVTLTNSHMYLSRKQVPATVGSPASNIEYWLDVGSYNGFIDDLQQQIDDIVTDVNAKANQNTIAPVENGNTVSIAGGYDIGDEFYRNGVLYKAITPIANGTAWSSLTLGTNYAAAATVMGQVAQMRSEYDTTVKQIKPKRIVCITDSYGTHSTVTNWCTVLAELFGLSGSNFYYWAEGSSGFEHTGLSGHTFLTLLQAHVSSISDPETITDVFIGGGTNDFYYFTNLNNLITAMTGTATYIKNTFPNAKIHYVFMGYDTIMSSTLRSNYIETLSAYQAMSYRAGVNVINAYEPMHIGALREDHQHPSTAGGTEIARDIYCKYFGSEYLISSQSDDLTITPASGLTIANNKIWFDVMGNEGVVRINNLLIEGAISINNNTMVEIGTISNRLGQSVGNGKTAARMATSMKYKDSNSNPGTCPISLFIQADTSDNSLHLYGIITDYGTRTLSEFKIPSCDFTFPLVYC